MVSPGATLSTSLSAYARVDSAAVMRMLDCPPCFSLTSVANCAGVETTSASQCDGSLSADAGPSASPLAIRFSPPRAAEKLKAQKVIQTAILRLIRLLG